jgi:hypothetical protein
VKTIIEGAGGGRRWRRRRVAVAEEEEVSLDVIMTNTGILHIFHIISLFNLPFFHIFHNYEKKIS